MKTFRFRAQPALDLRHKQEEAAEVALAAAEARFAASKRAVDDSLAKEAAAELARADGVRAGMAAHALLWHRNWIIALAAAVETCRREMNRQHTAVAEARQAWYDARRRRLMLERLRDRARARHRAAEERVELQQIDELARMRFMLAAAERSSE